MKQFGLAALVLGTAALILVAKAASPVTIQYATWDATREKADKKLIAAFEKSHPEIKVKYNLVAWDTYWQKAAAMTAGGATFDVLWMNLDNFPFYASQGALEGIPITAEEKAMYPAASINPYLNSAGTTAYGLLMFSMSFAYLLGTFMCRRMLRRWGLKRTVAVAAGMTLTSVRSLSMS